MTIQINADNNLNLKQEYKDKLKDTLTNGLSRYTGHLSRLELHLSDINGNKDAQNDKRCVLEARLEGRPPIAVTNLDNTYDQAVNGAIAKLDSSLNTIIGKIKNH
ncbi:HPF/RaiA family ribosome-associated protein [Pedobacter nototheniae]|uniref:HPF/RaiA family ribosome-associated protein n=1 Tax=Pedobacter nototheniae TaxID=2488994 RepID=UPI00292FBF59|nr:HPF/RaiA family ribosome-associated protein [Pedobacter nototheniae]